MKCTGLPNDISILNLGDATIGGTARLWDAGRFIEMLFDVGLMRTKDDILRADWQLF